MCKISIFFFFFLTTRIRYFTILLDIYVNVRNRSYFFNQCFAANFAAEQFFVSFPTNKNYYSHLEIENQQISRLRFKKLNFNLETAFSFFYLHTLRVFFPRIFIIISKANNYAP